MVFDFSSLSVINVSAPAVCSCHDLVVDTDSVDAVDTLLLCLSFQFCLCSIPLSMFTLPFFFFLPDHPEDGIPVGEAPSQRSLSFSITSWSTSTSLMSCGCHFTLINYTVQPFDTLNMKCFKSLLDLQIDAIMKMAGRQGRETGR